MTPAEFLANHGPKLLGTRDSYLGGDLSHFAMQESAWLIIEACTSAGLGHEEPHLHAEDTFWTTVWAVQHLVWQKKTILRFWHDRRDRGLEETLNKDRTLTLVVVPSHTGSVIFEYGSRKKEFHAKQAALYQVLILIIR